MVPAALLATHALPVRRDLLPRLLCASLTMVSVAVLLVAAAPVFSGGHVDQMLGEPVAGVALALRADAPALVIACLSGLGTVLALLDRGRTRSECEALMVCLLGGLLCALAANVTGLFAGLEIGNLGALLLMRGGVHRLSRPARLGLVVQHLAAMGLLAAAVELQLTRGTTDLTTLTAAPLAAGPVVLWALAGSARLLAPIIPRRRIHARNHLAGMAVAAAPCGVIVLLRLIQASNGDLPAPATVVLGALGAVAALGGAVAALRRHRAPAGAGRCLCIAGGGMTIAGAALHGPAGQIGFAAAAVGLVLVLFSAPAWNTGGKGGRPRPGGPPGRPDGPPAVPRGGWPAALALAIAGGLPLGFGATALILELDAVVAGGPPQAVLLLVLGPAAVLAAVASGLAARTVLAAPAAEPGIMSASATPPEPSFSATGARHEPSFVATGSQNEPSFPATRARLEPSILATGAQHEPPFFSWVGAVGTGVSLVGALLPGMALRFVVAPLAGVDAVTAIDAGSIRGPGGGWSGGYLTLAWLVAIAVGASVMVLLGSPSPMREHAHAGGIPPQSPLAWDERRTGASWRPWGWVAAGLAMWAVAALPRGAQTILVRADRWLVDQPQLLWVVAGIAVTAFLFR